jgi:hypothetical protein
MSAELLKIPKELIEVRLQDSRGESHDGSLFVSESHQQRERLQDMLSWRKFVPLRMTDGQVKFFSRQHITWIRTDLIDAFGELDPEAEANRSSVCAGMIVELDDGRRVSGAVRYLRPDVSRRVSDYLEALTPFFPLRTSQWLYLVNRDRIVSVTPIDEVRS